MESFMLIVLYEMLLGQYILKWWGWKCLEHLVRQTGRNMVDVGQ
jgi:hypothetical protein